MEFISVHNLTLIDTRQNFNYSLVMSKNLKKHGQNEQNIVKKQ